MPHEILRVAMDVPIAPILLLPFILVFFVIVFPIWGVSLIVLGIVLGILKGLNAALVAAGAHGLEPVVKGVQRALRWVLTFGGFTDRYRFGPPPEEPVTHRGNSP